jgi:hypothetical protein
LEKPVIYSIKISVGKCPSMADRLFEGVYKFKEFDLPQANQTP